MKLPGSKAMQAIDRCAIEDFGIPGVVLMENAGIGTIRLMEERLGLLAGSFCLIFIGPGNNGGDGLVIGRHLHQRGCEPIFFFLVDPDTLSGEAAINLAIVQNLKFPLHVIDSPSRVKTMPALIKQIESRGLPCCAIIDAIFGTGLSKQIRGYFADTIDLLNELAASKHLPVIAVDIPSGLNADNGNTLGRCVKATMTATFACAKPGHVMHGGTDHIGDLHIIDIGIPPEVISKANISTSMITAEIASGWAVQLTRKRLSHKGNLGHLLILAGSAGKTGAAILACKGALRSGCGLVSLCVPHDLNNVFETCLIEAMTLSLPSSSSRLNVSDLSTIIRHAENKSAVVLGPGLGEDSSTAELVLYLFQNLEQPMVIDADALNIVAGYQDQITKCAGPRIFTPHPGEMARLIGQTTDQVQENRINAAKMCYEKYKNGRKDLIVILKGAGTVIVMPNQEIMINSSGNPGMATGGMGDVLSGMIGSFICQGMPPVIASGTAVYLHGMAGDRLYDQMGQGYTASELADNLPANLKRLQEGN
ncbi:MAG: NAD(P)H-hydrate dehydratase [Deltaproteobacteria bacterium]|nr:NAD(P)H-hydrate dehydratase [Deltaproteobacteria bacterium]